METHPKIAPTSKALVWTGRVLSALPALMMLAGGIFGLINPAAVKEGFGKYGYPESCITWIMITELVCVLLYAIPQTSVLGAILLTGYLGGATATHVRVGEPQAIAPVILGIVIWLGLLLRDARLRALLPFRR